MAEPRRAAAEAMQRLWQARGPGSTALLPAAWLFGVGTALRRRFFERGDLASNRLPVPVIVVGNLVVGGAGKTPAVIAVVALLRRHGYTPGIVSRGYGRRDESIVAAVAADSEAAAVGDEPLLLRRRTNAPVFVGRDRVAAAHAMLQSEPAVDVIVSDDGLQHLALERDAEVVVFDERGAGNGRLLPAGPLREALPTKAVPRRLVLYNAPAPTTPLAGFLGERRLAGARGLDEWWNGEPPSLAVLDALRGRDVLAACGLARPQRFFAMLREHGLAIRELALEDHHAFATLPWPASSTDVIVTEKDAVKLPPSRRMNTRVWVAALDFEPEPAFESALLALLAPSPIAATES